METAEDLVARFAELVIAQDMEPDLKRGNQLALELSAVFKTLVERFGDPGRDKLATLFTHPYRRVRAMAASFLLRYRHEEALEVLEQLKQGSDFVAFAAECLLFTWEKGLWELDMIEDQEVHANDSKSDEKRS